MLTERASGILLHPSSLPGPGGIGTLGAGARGFVDWLAAARQSWWQTLPLNPTGNGASPYSATSSFAGNPLLLDLEALVAADLLERAEVDGLSVLPNDRVDYARAIKAREDVLWQAAGRLCSRAGGALVDAMHAFEAAHNDVWLEDYATWEALSQCFGRKHWRDWDANIRARDPQAMAEVRFDLRSDIASVKALQFLFDHQWQGLRAYAHSKGVRLIGDLPIFVADNAADVWAQPELFKLDENFQQTVQAGVPPDYFSTTGQLWGNPLYRWETHAADGFAWWVGRMRRLYQTVDMVRIDHFRGFAACWEVPGGDKTAEHGQWVTAPGQALFSALTKAFGDMPVIAEDLGFITEDVLALRDGFHLPGLKILQFEFGNGPPTGDAHPKAYPANSVTYTGTHDNNTTLGWFLNDSADAEARGADAAREAAAALAALGGDGSDIHWRMIELGLASGSHMALFPLQDVLGLDGSGRMNVPGTIEGNWAWRFSAGDLTPELAARLADLTHKHGRLPVWHRAAD